MKSTTTLSEVQLVAALQKKQVPAFSILYDNYSPALFGVILRIVKNREQAEDLLHDAFIKIWANIHQYDTEQGRLFTWLLAIARNVALDQLRKQNVQLVELTNIPEQMSPVTNPEIHEGLLYQSIYSLLPSKYQQVLELVFNHGCTQDEIACQLDLPVGTVKTRIRMGMQKLKRALNQDISCYQGVTNTKLTITN